MTAPDIAGLCERLRTPTVLSAGKGFEPVVVEPSAIRIEAAVALERQAAELARVREALERALEGVKYVPGDHPIVPIKHDAFVKAVQRIAAEIARMREALAPLGRDHWIDDPMIGDVRDEDVVDLTMTIGELRRARAALTGEDT